jgi:hypothetical protein
MNYCRFCSNSRDKRSRKSRMRERRLVDARHSTLRELQHRRHPGSKYTLGFPCNCYPYSYPLQRTQLRKHHSPEEVWLDHSLTVV